MIDVLFVQRCCFVLMKSVEKIKNKIWCSQTETMCSLSGLFCFTIKINCVDAVLKGMSAYKVTAKSFYLLVRDRPNMNSNSIH